MHYCSTHTHTPQNKTNKQCPWCKRSHSHAMRRNVSRKALCIEKKQQAGPQRLLSSEGFKVHFSCQHSDEWEGPWWQGMGGFSALDINPEKRTMPQKDEEVVHFKEHFSSQAFAVGTVSFYLAF